MRRLPRNAGSPRLLEPSDPVQAYYRECFTFSFTFQPCGSPATVLFTHIVMFIDVGTRRHSPTKRSDDLFTAMPLWKANMDKESFETVVSELNSGTFVLSH